MNFRQLHTSATPQERQETIEQMLQTIEARQHRLVIVNGRLIRDRRSVNFRCAHFLNDKRRHRITPGERLLLGLTLNLGIWSLSLPHAPQIAVPIVAVNLFALSLLFLVHPMPKPIEHSALAQTA